MAIQYKRELYIIIAQSKSIIRKQNDKNFKLLLAYI